MAGVHQRPGSGAVFRLLGRYRLDLRRLGKCKLAAIGPPPPGHWRTGGSIPKCARRAAPGEALARALTETVRPGERVLLLRSAQGSPELTNTLREAGLKVHDLALYTAKALPGPEPLPELDVLTFGSARGRTSLCGAIRPRGAPAPWPSAPSPPGRWSGPGCPPEWPRRSPPKVWPGPVLAWAEERKK